MAASRRLIVTIVTRGWGDRVLQASVDAGADGGTIMLGRGMGIHERQKLLGICIEPEKEIVLSVVPRDKVDGILKEIVKAAQLDKPGKGLAFVVAVEELAGVVHIPPRKTAH